MLIHVKASEQMLSSESMSAANMCLCSILHLKAVGQSCNNNIRTVAYNNDNIYYPVVHARTVSELLFGE